MLVRGPAFPACKAFTLRSCRAQAKMRPDCSSMSFLPMPNGSIRLCASSHPLKMLQLRDKCFRHLPTSDSTPKSSKTQQKKPRKHIRACLSFNYSIFSSSNCKLFGVSDHPSHQERGPYPTISSSKTRCDADISDSLNKKP